MLNGKFSYCLTLTKQNLEDTRDSFVLRVRLQKVVGRRFPSRWKRVASKAIP